MNIIALEGKRRSLTMFGPLNFVSCHPSDERSLSSPLSDLYCPTPPLYRRRSLVVMTRRLHRYASGDNAG